jgi:hypothetical protein
MSSECHIAKFTTIDINNYHMLSTAKKSRTTS